MRLGHRVAEQEVDVSVLAVRNPPVEVEGLYILSGTEGDGVGVDVLEESGGGNPEEHTGLLIIVNIRNMCERGVTQRSLM